MNGRERINAAFLPSGAPEIAAVLSYENILFRDHWEQLTDQPWWSRVSPDITIQMAWYRDFLNRTGLDWCKIPRFYSRKERVHITLRHTPGGVFIVNDLDGSREPVDPYGLIEVSSSSDDTRPVHPEHIAETTDEIDASVAVPESAAIEEFLAEGRNDLAARFLDEFDWVYPYFRVPSPYWGCYDLWGFEEMMIKTVTRPDLVEYACRLFLRLGIQSVGIAKVLGAAGIFIEEAMTDMVSPEAYRSLVLPWIRILTDEIRARGMKSIYSFGGNPAGKWERILDSGADAFAFEEGKKGFDIDVEDVVEKAGGRYTVLGNLDSIGVLQNGSERDLRTEIKRQIAAGRRNKSRFIMNLGSPVTPETPVERVRLYFDLVHELGKER